MHFILLQKTYDVVRTKNIDPTALYELNILKTETACVLHIYSHSFL